MVYTNRVYLGLLSLILTTILRFTNIIQNRNSSSFSIYMNYIELYSNMVSLSLSMFEREEIYVHVLLLLHSVLCILLTLSQWMLKCVWILFTCVSMLLLYTIEREREKLVNPVSDMPIQASKYFFLLFLSIQYYYLIWSYRPSGVYY